MIEIEKQKIERVEINDDTKYGKFVGEPLERG
jgi:DNA-directed RNA polymerase subunit alpha